MSWESCCLWVTSDSAQGLLLDLYLGFILGGPKDCMGLCGSSHGQLYVRLAPYLPYRFSDLIRWVLFDQTVFLRGHLCVFMGLKKLCPFEIWTVHSTFFISCQQYCGGLNLGKIWWSDARERMTCRHLTRGQVFLMGTYTGESCNPWACTLEKDLPCGHINWGKVYPLGTYVENTLNQIVEKNFVCLGAWLPATSSSCMYLQCPLLTNLPPCQLAD